MDKRLPVRRPRSGAIRADTTVVVPPSLSGADLVDFIARHTTLQKQRWVDVYRRLWERKAKIDIIDTVLLVDGCVSDWFFTSSATGELQRKADAGVTFLAIKRHFVRAADAHGALSRPLARLLVQDGGGVSFALLTDLEFNLVLGQRASSLWQAGFLLQPLVAWPAQAKQPPGALRGTFVAKYSSLAAAAACTRVLQLGPDELYELSPCNSGRHAPAATSSGHGARMRRAREASSEAARRLEEIVRGELRRLVQELERAFGEPLRLLTAEFQATPTRRLVLVRVSSVVLASDLAQPPGRRRGGELGDLASPSLGLRPQSAPVSRKSSLAVGGRCAGRAFCDCAGVATTLKAALPLASARRELQQITRRSVSLSEEESEYLAHFGAEAEATLTAASTDIKAAARRGLGPSSGAAAGDDGATARLLQRRLFMLRNTLWNPKSDAFRPTIMALQDAQRLPQRYEMVAVCRTCYLIYHSIDAERFQVAQATAKEAAERLTALYASQLVASEQAALLAASASSTSRRERRRGAQPSIPSASAAALAWASPSSQREVYGGGKCDGE